MRTALLLALVLSAALIWSTAAAAKPPPVSGTLAIAPGSDLQFGGAVTFDWTISGRLKGNEYPMVYLACFQDADGDGLVTVAFAGADTVYGQLDYPQTVFILGGGWSPWWNTPGPALCKAWLMVYGGAHGGTEADAIASTPIFGVD